MDRHLVGSLLLPAYLTIRDAVFLGRTCKAWYDALLSEHGAVFAYLAAHHIPVVWWRVSKCAPDEALPWKPTGLMYASHVQRRASLYRSHVFCWKPAPASKAVVLKQLEMRCRECFVPTTSTACPSSGRGLVRLCVDCAKRPDTYSELVDRAGIWDLYAARQRAQAFVLRKRRVIEYIKSPAKVARRGGNRAWLYWKHDVLTQLFEVGARSQ